MAVKKGILDNFLKPSSHYNENQKNIGSIFINNQTQERSEESILNSDTKDKASLSPFDQIINQLSSVKLDFDNEELKKIDNELRVILNDGKPLEPISNQLVTNISNQLATNKEPISNQKTKLTRSKGYEKEPISNPISNHNKEPISNQLVTQLVTSIPDISLLTGLQKKILFFIVEDCIYRGQLISGCITNEALREITKTTANTVKTAVQRLIKKGFIKRNPDKNGKRGKGGFSSFIITKDVRDGVIIEKRAPRISNQLVTQLVTPNSNQLVTNKESNREPNTLSSSLNIKNTTTELSKEWQDINIEPLKEIGFTENRLWKLKNHGIDRKALQASIDHFAFDLKHNNKAASIKKTPIEFFMGIMLHDGYYTPPANYESPQEKARRLYIEHEEAKSKETAAMIERLLNVEFEKWYEGLSDEQKNEILPDSLRHAKERKFGREYLKNHFKENIWQDSFQKLEANGYNLALSVS